MNLDDRYKRFPTKFREKRRRKQDAINDFIRAIKQQPCADCGVQYPHYVMEFDHCGGDKAGNVSKFNNWESVIEEIAKCQVVCANCHRARTHERSIR